ncbi:acyl carrier protein [Nitrospirillum sp. BR 11752]|uniref:acyl carrier protein n=1 Tax=Nitrospirillum sp. BR 11752 TaxID=3104293 RepID=UPI002EBB3387|nr:acyl carrier protein [Nitrospirillum sp. BR 11752]
MDENKVYILLSSVFSDVFFRDDIILSPTLSAKDVDGWDSYKQVEIILCIEEKFGITLSSREIDGLQCVGDLVRVIRGKLLKSGL